MEIVICMKWIISLLRPLDNQQHEDCGKTADYPLRRKSYIRLGPKQPSHMQVSFDQIGYDFGDGGGADPAGPSAGPYSMANLAALMPLSAASKSFTSIDRFGTCTPEALFRSKADSTKRVVGGNAL